MVRSGNIIATPPGATIKEQLVDKGMSQKEFAIRMAMSEKHISKLINGEVQLTHDVAFRLEFVLGIPASFWNNLEAIYREKLLQIEIDNSMSGDIEIVKKFPYAELVNRGWILEGKTDKDKVKNVRQFFEVTDLSILENSFINRIACKRLAINDFNDLSLMAWVQQAKVEARNKKTKAFNLKKLEESIPIIRQMTCESLKVIFQKLEQQLAECGIALVYIPGIKGLLVQRTTFMCNNKIVIAMVKEDISDDEFWLNLFHELGHIVLGHLEIINGITVEDEMKADRWAEDCLIPKDDYINFVNSNKFTKNSIKALAERLSISAGIVIFKLQNDGIINNKVSSDYK